MADDTNSLVEHLEQAGHALLAGDRTAADEAMIAIAFRRMQTEHRASLPVSLQASVMQRDGFACRYCERRTVPPVVLRVFAVLFPTEFPYHPNWRRDSTHVAFWQIASSVDHLVAGTEGGLWTDPDNLVNACWTCNIRKSNLSLDDLGWSLRPLRSGWDGLTRLYPGLWAAAGSPDPSSHRPWLRAFEKG